MLYNVQLLLINGHPNGSQNTRKVTVCADQIITGNTLSAFPRTSPHQTCAYADFAKKSTNSFEITNKNNKNITVKIYVGVNIKNVIETLTFCRLCDVPTHCPSNFRRQLKILRFYFIYQLLEIFSCQIETKAWPVPDGNICQYYRERTEQMK